MILVWYAVFDSVVTQDITVWWWSCSEDQILAGQTCLCTVYSVHYTVDILHLVTLHSHTVTNQARCTCIHVDTYMFVMFTCVYVCIFTHMYMCSCAHCISAPLYMCICVSNSCDLFNHLYIHVHLTASLTPCFLLCNHIHSCVDVYVYMWQQYYHLLCNLITSLYVYMWL